MHIFVYAYIESVCMCVCVPAGLLPRPFRAQISPAIVCVCVCIIAGFVGRERHKCLYSHMFYTHVYCCRASGFVGHETLRPHFYSDYCVVGAPDA
jgi:hypothetical protein